MVTGQATASDSTVAKGGEAFTVSFDRPAKGRRGSRPTAGRAVGGSMPRTPAGSPVVPQAPGPPPRRGTPPDESAVAALDAAWVYAPPPDLQTTATFASGGNVADGSDGITFSSRFDSGNAYRFEQQSAGRYRVYPSADCQGSPQEVVNRQWYHFSVEGVRRGTTLTLTVAGLPFIKMYTFGYAPVVACSPFRQSFYRVPGKVAMVAAAVPPAPPPPRPAGPASATPEADGSDVDGGDTPLEGQPLADDGKARDAKADKKEAPRSKRNPAYPAHVDLTFEFTFDFDATSPGNPQQHPCVYYFANTYPYSYARLQRHLAAWVPHCPVTDEAPRPCDAQPLSLKERTVPAAVAVVPGPNGPKTAKAAEGPPAAPAVPADAPAPEQPKTGRVPKGRYCGPTSATPVYTHRELLARTLDGNRCDLLTITSSTGLPPDAAKAEAVAREEPYAPDVPLSYPQGHKRPAAFPNRRYVVLSARVHPGEVPASHMLHGCIDFLMSPTDARAQALRENYVFVVVPMINPDGVSRGHSRADTNGVNLNRQYKCPSKLRHPTTYALRHVLMALQRTGRLSLYIDMHAHANKRGAFFYGNALSAADQVQNLLYAKLVALNSPYFDFPGCNFSEQNMFAVGKNGDGKDGSSRVAMYTETGFVHCYTVEANYVTGPALGPVAGLPGVPGEEADTTAGTPCPKYTPAVFHDLGRGMCTALLDLHSLNPQPRLPHTALRNTAGVKTWVQRQLLHDAYEQHRRMSAIAAGVSISSTPLPINVSPADLPRALTTKASPTFPPTTTFDIAALASTAPPSAFDFNGKQPLVSAPSATTGRPRASRSLSISGPAPKHRSTSARGPRTASEGPRPAPRSSSVRRGQKSPK